MKKSSPKIEKQNIAWTAWNDVAAGGTSYMVSVEGYGNGGNTQAAETECMCGLIITRRGTIKSLAIHSEVAPGAGESFTYTLRINGVATALTFTIEGAAATSNSIEANVAVAVGDRVTVQLVTSVGAAACTHMGRSAIDY